MDAGIMHKNVIICLSNNMTSSHLENLYLLYWSLWSEIEGWIPEPRNSSVTGIATSTDKNLWTQVIKLEVQVPSFENFFQKISDVYGTSILEHIDWGMAALLRRIGTCAIWDIPVSNSTGTKYFRISHFELWSEHITWRKSLYYILPPLN